MKRTLTACLLIASIVLFFSSCDEVLPVSKSERLALFVSDLNADRNDQLYKHFSQDDMVNDWGTVTSGDTYWESGIWLNEPFTYTISSSDATTITANFVGGPGYLMKFYFVLDNNVTGADVWLIYQLDVDGTPELN